jgi:hypothetical protein
VSNCTVLLLLLLLLLLLFILAIERGSTRSHAVKNSFCKRLWTCRKTYNRMNECTNQSVYNYTRIPQTNHYSCIVQQPFCGCHIRMVLVMLFSIPKFCAFALIV